jgi:hypothetical protein
VGSLKEMSRGRSSTVRLSAVPIVRHAIPGRVCLRLEPPDADRGEEVARALAAQEGVRDP